MSFIGKILKSVFGSASERQIKEILPLVDRVNEIAEKYQSLSDDELRAKTDDFKKRIAEYTAEIRQELERVKGDLAGELGEEARERASDLREKLESNLHEEYQEILDEILPEAFALVKETCYRLTGVEFVAAGQNMVWGDDVTSIYAPDEFEWTERTPPGYSRRWVAELPEANAHELTNSFTLVRFEDGRVMRAVIPFDVQIIGGIVLHQGKITEMATGEGKTLAAVMPVYLNALTGRGVHIVTVNDYLAQRDAAWMGQIYGFLGLTVGCIHGGITPHTPERREQYRKDITYGTNNEFGFDYLRDNLARQPDEQVQREHHYAIVDEVDSVLIDEARTPLIISGPVDSKIHERFRNFEPKVDSLVRKQTSQSTRLLDEAERELKDAGFFDESAELDRDKSYRAGEKLLQVKRSTPKISRFLKLTKEPGVAKLIQRIEADKLRDKIMHELDEELFFAVDEHENSINLTEKGRQALDSAHPEIFELPDITAEISEIEGDESLTPVEKAEAKKKAYALYSERSEINHAISQLLKAHVLFAKDVDYVVMEGKVIIVDSFTGRLMPGRRYSDGLHQALEAKESVNVQSETQTVATITLQNYFRMYDKLAGMTGTAETEAGEFWEIYKLDVIVIPTNRPVRRSDYDDEIYLTRREKYNAALDEIEYWHRLERPVLVGTVSVDVSETLSRMLKRRKISHSVLNAKQHQKEAEIVAHAGRPGSVTIATNMAGRGTDIKLGKSVVRCSEGCHLLSDEPNDALVAEEEWTLGKCREEIPCGLHIIGTERHESRRIDRQLRGRSGRQGDPGSSRFYLSLEDDLMRLFGSERIASVMDRFGAEKGEVIKHPFITKQIERAQKRVEAQNFAIRKHLLEYDDVNNAQREVIYRRRQQILDGGSLKDEYKSMIRDYVETLLDKYTLPTAPSEDWNWQDLKADFSRTFLYAFEPQAGAAQRMKQSALEENLLSTAFEAYDHREKLLSPEIMRQLERYVLLHTIDEQWKEHLYALDGLKEGISLRAYGQKDPLIEYKREAFGLFTELLDRINRLALERLFRAQVAPPPPQTLREAAAARLREVHRETDGYGAGAAARAAGIVEGATGGPRRAPMPSQQGIPKPKTVVSDKKVGRNDPCPCGSGKKYKNCCGKR